MREITIPAVPEHVVEEDIVSITIESSMKNIVIVLAQYKDGVRFNQYSVSLGNQGYQLLMETPSPEWAPNKPLGSFRKEDVFIVLDLLGL